MLRSPIIVAVTRGPRTAASKSWSIGKRSILTWSAGAPQQQEQKSSQVSDGKQLHVVTDCSSLFGARERRSRKAPPFYSPLPYTSQLQPRLIRPLADAATTKARRTLRSLGARTSQPKRLLRWSRQGGGRPSAFAVRSRLRPTKSGEFRKDSSELCSEERHWYQWSM